MDHRISDAVEDARSSYYRMVLVAGVSGSGKTAAILSASDENDWRYVNVGLSLAESLEAVRFEDRSRVAADGVDALTRPDREPAIALDNMEILFNPSLGLRPLEILKRLSRSRTLAVAWPGTLEGTVLTYAEPGWPEYATFDVSDLSVLPIESIVNL